MSDVNIYNEALLPPIMERFLERPRLASLLKDALNKPLTTIIAGAGYGKTQAVLAALRSIECKPVWIQLTQLDNHTVRFWEHIAYALKPYGYNLYNGVISLGYPETIANFDQFVRLLAREFTQKERAVFLFDDFHLIRNKTILDFIKLFISSLVQNFSIVIISRTKPDLSLTGLQYKKELTRVTEDDLRFSKNEMDEYFHNQGIAIPDKTSRDIYFYTEGWVLAIYLIGLAVKKGSINSQNPILAVKIDIFDLIEKEIFSSASIKLRNFLVEISILDAIPSGLLNELVQNNFSIISEMMKLSLFIRYDSFSDSFYIHNLFREFLLERKGWLKESTIKKMHLTAAEWFLKNNRKYEAIEHYKECNFYNKIFDILLSITHHVPKEVADSFMELIERAPEEILHKRPVIRVAKVKYLCNNNRIEEAVQEAANIRKEFEALPNTEENQAVLGEVYTYLAFISVINLDYGFEELFKMADACLPSGSKLIDHKTTIADGINVCSIKDPSAGELKRHQDALFTAAPYASRAMNGCTHGMEYLNAAESSLYTGELKAAERYAYEAIYRSRQHQQYDIEYMANFVLLRVLTSKGNYAKILDILNQMKTQLEHLQIPNCIPLYDIIEGWFYVKIGKTDKIAQWIKYEEETRKIFPPMVLGREYLVRSDCLLAEGRYYELLAFMEQTDGMYEARGILFARIQNKITRAIIHHYIGNYERSIHMLHEAYQLTHPNNLVMQYIEYGNQMRTLIYAARRSETCKIPKEWLDKIYTRSSTYAKQLAQIVSAYNKAHILENTDQSELSKRELEVLAYLCRGLTREEIAESCYLAIGSINDIVNNIYAKLGAVNAADAVRIAKEKHIL